jgi:hypothetical protein
MATKELINKRILQYINLAWDVKNAGNLDPLVRLMIEAISNELYLLDNKLEDIHISVSHKLVNRLLPAMSGYVRPSHAILQVNPSVSIYKLDKHTNFTLKELPDDIRYQNLSSVSFTPVVNANIHDINISHIFHDRTLWAVTDRTRKVLGYSGKRAEYNTIWLGLDISAEIETLGGIAFYLDFEHLQNHHDYYDIMSELRWSIGNEPLKMKKGFPVSLSEEISTAEKEILNFYEDHFQTVASKTKLKDIHRKRIPDELAGITDSDITSSISPRYWFSVAFPANFLPEDVEKITISLNAVPIVNRYHNRYIVQERNLGNIVSLSSGAGQEFLNIESVSDNRNNIYAVENQPGKEYSYAIEPVQRRNTEDPRIIDYLERLADIVQEERTAFPGIDNDKIIDVLNAVSSIRDKDTQKIERNRLKEYAEIALLRLNPGENPASATVTYWTTQADLLNGIAKDTPLMASKIPELNKSDAILLTGTYGGRNFYSLESLKAINNFYLTSGDRILTKYNILGFCRIELGEYIEKVDVVRKAIISHKLKEGIIIVMEIQVTPKQEHLEYFKQKGVFKDLLVRLRQRSPNNFNYRIRLMYPE